MKYPDECPVFEFCGEHFVGVPWLFEYAQEVDGDITLVDDRGFSTFVLVAGDSDFKALTPAAEELVQWMRQS